MRLTALSTLCFSLWTLAAGGCGSTPESLSDAKIFGGIPVAPGAWPQVVGIAARSSGAAEYETTCTGTLIAPQVVLIAGHCVEGSQEFVVYTGDGQDKPRVAADTTLAITQKILHPALRRYPLGYADFALLTLAQPLTGIAPLPLVTTLAEQLQADQQGQALLVGYGRREDDLAGRKFQAAVAFGPRTSAELVVGGDGRDACQGDSGGPALSQRADGTYALLGVVSRGLNFECGDGGYVGLTSDVACWLATESGLPVPTECRVTAPHYSDARMARAEFYRLCSGKQANASQRSSIRNLMLGLGFKTCREATAYLTAAKDLILDGMMLKDLSPLASFTQLETLSLIGNRLTDLAPLALLTRLKVLKIDANDIMDVDALARQEADGLLIFGKRRQRGNYFDTEFLKLCRDSTTPDSARKTIKAVFWTTMAENCDQANERLLGLTSLRFRGRQLTDLTPLQGLAGLTVLDLAQNPLDEVAPLATLENLTKLDLTDTDVTDLSALAPLMARGLIITGATP